MVVIISIASALTSVEAKDDQVITPLTYFAAIRL